MRSLLVGRLISPDGFRRSSRRWPGSLTTIAGAGIRAARKCFARSTRSRWELCGENPVRLLQETSGEALARAAGDSALLARVASLEDAFAADLGRPAVGPVAPERPIAFFCAEFGVHRSLPIYSGGLGALAGDLLKEASDRALPLVAVGLMYRQGYFRQRLEVSGWQQEYWVDVDPERLPAALVRAQDGRPLTISVPIRGREVSAQIWRVAVGRVPLFLLDADVPENGRLERWITSQLYVADPITRLSQYALLGVGGVRALAALGIEPALVHLNEGHAAFAVLELARGEAARGASARGGARGGPAADGVHDPHAGRGRQRDLPPRGRDRHARGSRGELGVDPELLLRLGRYHPEDGGEPFGMTTFSLRMSRAANGVSRRHGAVAREMWRGLWPERAVEAVPITHVTNGVHLPSWVGPPMRRLLDRHLGEEWLAAGERGRDLGGARRGARRRAVGGAARAARRAGGVRQGTQRDRPARRAPAARGDRGGRPRVRPGRAHDRVRAAQRDLQAPRAPSHDPGRALALLAGPQPVQFVLAGKAHPSDEEAKRVVQELFRFKDAPHVAERVVYLHDYDLGMAARLVRGCDLWLNLPRPPIGGQRDQRDEGGHQRRPEPERARRLVGGGLRRNQRLGPLRRGRPRPRGAGRA